MPGCSKRSISSGHPLRCYFCDSHYLYLSLGDSRSSQMKQQPEQNSRCGSGGLLVKHLLKVIWGLPPPHSALSPCSISKQDSPETATEKQELTRETYTSGTERGHLRGQQSIVSSTSSPARSSPVDVLLSPNVPMQPRVAACHPLY